ncbi:cytochrome b561 [Saccharopolyspora shandongensis]|uniref:Cytochrome b561 n=1 Tax=Saccharopolyspora shandongensis TaxID=418495 RepID=A0A1H3SPE7_9PSEU|nr:cytochrome b [Saccharopolyspora shandongensis]SDZ39597.1 cytochrome b561 [Saccharopolyspora shandongensis]
MNNNSPHSPARYTVFSRVLHWVMAVMVIAMLFIGVAMVASPSAYHALLFLHRPLGIAILALVVVRFVNRLLRRPPAHSATMSPAERVVATGSEYLLYALLFAQPLIGWAMTSAAGTPVVLYGPLHLPAILPPSASLYSTLREAHTVLAYLLFFAFTAHMCAVLFHALVLRDGLLDRMAFWHSTRPKR